MLFSTLHSPIRWFFLAHALAGAAALALLAIPLVSKKGGKAHTRAGWGFTAGMTAVALSAFIITPWRAFADPARTSSSEAFALFLALVGMLMLSALNHAIQALRAKTRTTPSRALEHVGLPILLGALAIGVLLAGTQQHDIRYLGFPILALLTVRSQLLYWLNAPSERNHALLAHVSGMSVASIAAITAFLVTALPRLTTHPWFHSPLLWFAPGLILGPLFARFEARYRPKPPELSLGRATG